MDTWRLSWLPGWRHQLKTFSALLDLCEGNPVTESFDVFLDLLMSKRMSKQWRRRWFETSSRSSWLHCNVRSFHFPPLISPTSHEVMYHTKCDWHGSICMNIYIRFSELVYNSQKARFSITPITIDRTKGLPGGRIFRCPNLISVLTVHCQSSSKKTGPLLLTWLILVHDREKWFHSIVSGRRVVRSYHKFNGG